MDYLFQDICLLDALLELFAQGHKAVALFIGNTHARQLAALFNDQTGLGWKRIAHKTCCETQGSLGVTYSIDQHFGEQLAEAGHHFIEAAQKNALSQPSFKEQCYQCFNTSETPMAKCSTCKKASYCSKECQAKDWRLHKQWCTDKK